MSSSPEPRSRRFLLEGLVIVASILLAFGIEAGWGELQEERDAAELASAMLSDVRASRTNLDTIRSLLDQYQRLDSSAVVLENALMRHYRDPAQPSRD